MLSTEDRDILGKFAKAVRDRFPEAKIWAFGSRAWGNPRPDSDFDICVVIDALDEDADRVIQGIAWEIGFASDVVISTMTYSAAEFLRGACSVSPLVRAVTARGLAA